ATEEERKEGLEIILKQSEQMSSLVSRLLMLARADSGKQVLKNEPVDLSFAAVTAVEKVREKAAARKIRIRCRVSPDLTVRGDAGSRDQVFSNRLENAGQ